MFFILLNMTWVLGNHNLGWSAAESQRNVGEFHSAWSGVIILVVIRLGSTDIWIVADIIYIS